MANQGEAEPAAPTHAQLERAISSVTGVISADVSQPAPGAPSRLRIRIAPGEDAEAVSWAVSATLRERFGIALDPDDIRPRSSEQIPAGEPLTDPVHLVTDRGDEMDVDAVAGAVDVRDPGDSSLAPEQELSETRDRLTTAAQEALDGLHSRFGGGRRGSDVRPTTGDGALASDALFAGSAASATSVSSPAELSTHGSMSSREPVHERMEQASPSASSPETEPLGREFTMSQAGSESPAQESSEGADREAASAAPSSPSAAPSRSGQSAGYAPGARYSSRVSGAVGVASNGSFVDRHRAAIRHLDTQRDPHDVRVTATLEHAGRSADGTAVAVATSQGVLRAVAEATVDALRVLAGPTLLAGVDRVTLNPAFDPATATVVVTLLSERGEETLLGASVVHGDPERAIMRATLDALNRRVEMLLEPA